MEAGIVGLPNVGKSTLFNALTQAQALAANYPFATIEPNVGVVAVPDARLKRLAHHVPTQKIVPATLRLVDIAGIVRGASQGEGLGNKFLSHIRQVDAIVHVVRCFENPGGEVVTHVEGSVDPLRDIATIETELILADLQQIETAVPKLERAAKGRDAESMAKLAVARRVQPVLEDGRPARAVAGDVTDPEERRAFASFDFLTGKRVLYVANVDEHDVRGEGAHASRVREHAQREGMQMIPACAKIESELAELDEADRDEMLAGLGLEQPALHALAQAAYRLLGVQSFYTAGPKEIRAWTIRTGTTAPEAAAEIHSDIARGFIRAEVYSVDDLEDLKTEKAIREAGRLRAEGRAYVMRDSDVVHFLFNV